MIGSASDPIVAAWLRTILDFGAHGLDMSDLGKLATSYVSVRN